MRVVEQEAPLLSFVMELFTLKHARAVGVPFLLKNSEVIWWLSGSACRSAVWSGCSMWVFVFEAKNESGRGKEKGRDRTRESYVHK